MPSDEGSVLEGNSELEEPEGTAARPPVVSGGGNTEQPPKPDEEQVRMVEKKEITCVSDQWLDHLTGRGHPGAFHHAVWKGEVPGGTRSRAGRGSHRAAGVAPSSEGATSSDRATA